VFRQTPVHVFVMAEKLTNFDFDDVRLQKLLPKFVICPLYT